MTTPNGMEPQYPHKAADQVTGTPGCAWLKDRAKRCSCGAVDYERQTGRSTKQMQDAPQRAAFIVQNPAYNYFYDLAAKAGRKDLRIRRQNTLDQGAPSFRGVEWPAIILDHSVVLTKAQQEALDILKPLIGRRA